MNMELYDTCFENPRGNPETACDTKLIVYSIQSWPCMTELILQNTWLNTPPYFSPSRAHKMCGILDSFHVKVADDGLYQSLCIAGHRLHQIIIKLSFTRCYGHELIRPTNEWCCYNVEQF